MMENWAGGYPSLADAVEKQWYTPEVRLPAALRCLPAALLVLCTKVHSLSVV
jgi:hypothetical protein